MNQPKSVSRIVGLIDLGKRTDSPLRDFEALVIAEKNNATCSEKSSLATRNENLKRSLVPCTETVYYQANLTQLMKQLERELHSFQRLFARAKALEQVSGI